MSCSSSSEWWSETEGGTIEEEEEEEEEEECSQCQELISRIISLEKFVSFLSFSCHW